MIIDDKQFDWGVLSQALKRPEKEVKGRWQDHIYPKLRTTNKVGGALKWSAAEDCILLGF